MVANIKRGVNVNRYWYMMPSSEGYREDYVAVDIDLRGKPLSSDHTLLPQGGSRVAYFLQEQTSFLPINQAKKVLDYETASACLSPRTCHRFALLPVLIQAFICPSVKAFNSAKSAYSCTLLGPVFGVACNVCDEKWPWYAL